MRAKLGFLLFGGIIGYSSQHIHNFYTPQRKVPPSSRQLIDNYISENNLQQAYLLSIMKGLNLMWKGFYHYGMDDKLEGFNFNNIYIKKQQEEGTFNHLYCIFSPTQYVCGHPEIQHGGATATIIDQNMGYLSMLHSHDIVATINLSVGYKKPVKKDQYYVLQVKVKQRDGRKIYLDGNIKDIETGQLKAVSEGIFMTVNWDHRMGRIIKKMFSKVYGFPEQISK